MSYNKTDSEDVERLFMAEFMSLLDRYEAEIDARDHYEGYPGIGQDVRMTLSIPWICDKSGDTVQAGVDVDLGSWVDAEVIASRYGE